MLKKVRLEKVQSDIFALIEYNEFVNMLYHGDAPAVLEAGELSDLSYIPSEYVPHIPDHVDRCYCCMAGDGHWTRGDHIIDFQRGVDFMSDEEWESRKAVGYIDYLDCPDTTPPEIDIDMLLDEIMETCE